MGKDRNDTVAWEWSKGRTACSHTGNLRTDGQQLWSYNLMIGYTCPKRGKVIKNYTASGRFYSMTTSQHVGLARRYASVEEEHDCGEYV